jgi:hypothetical protein
MTLLFAMPVSTKFITEVSLTTLFPRVVDIAGQSYDICKHCPITEISSMIGAMNLNKLIELQICFEGKLLLFRCPYPNPAHF